MREDGTTPLGTRKDVLVSSPPLFMTVRLAGGVGILEVEMLGEEEDWIEVTALTVVEVELEVMMVVLLEEVVVEAEVEAVEVVLVVLEVVKRDVGGMTPSFSLLSWASAPPCFWVWGSPGGRCGEPGEASDVKLYCWRLMAVSRTARSLR